MIIYGRYSWVIMEEMMKVLEGFHHQIMRRITGKTACRVGEEGWEFYLTGEAIEATGI